jgi:hypothetical protein
MDSTIHRHVGYTLTCWAGIYIPCLKEFLKRKKRRRKKKRALFMTKNMEW